MESREDDPSENTSKSSPREFVLFGEFSDLDESQWDTLTEEAEVPDQERKA